MNLIGITWCKNEGDLLPWTLDHAIKKVDAMMVIDDDSTDNSWDIIKSFDKRLDYHVRKQDIKGDSRQHLLDEVRRRYRVDDTWVQVIESDTIVYDTDIRSAINTFAVDDIAVHWNLLNACKRNWETDYDRFSLVGPGNAPWWVYTDCHWMELMSYTFRPLPLLHYTDRRTPWPQGFSNYTQKGYRKSKRPDSPLAMHYGYRTPRHYYEKMARLGRKTGAPKNPTWDLTSPERVRDTVCFFNGEWNNNRDVFHASRAGWADWIRTRQDYLIKEGW